MPARREAIILGPNQGTWLAWLGHPVRYLALGADTADRYALVWGRVPPGDGPPPHSHVFDEGFAVLSGELTFVAGNQSVCVPAGGFLHVPGGTAHYFKNHGKVEAELLVVAAPAGFDRFQLEAGRRVSGPEGPFPPVTPDDILRMMAVAPKYGIDLNPSAEAFRTAPRLTLKQPGEGRTWAIVGDLYTFLATAEDTDGRYAIWEALITPGGGPPPHVHSREEEGFYMLEGEITVFVEGRPTVVGPGCFAHMPVGVEHAFTNASDRPARMLILVAPGGFEKMFFEVGIEWPDRSILPPPPSPEEISRLRGAAPRYGLEFHFPQAQKG